MKRFIAGISLLAVVAPAAARADITIGVNVSATGPAASLGIPEQNAVTLGPKVIAGQKVRYVVYNDASDTTTAVQNVKRLISEDKADVIIGPSLVACTLAVVEAASEAKTPLISLAPGPASISPADAKRKWIFNAPPNDLIYNGAVVDHMLRNGVNKVAIISVDDAYGEANIKAFEQLAAVKGIKVVNLEKYRRTDTSVTAQVLRAMQANPGAVYIISSGTPAVLPHRGLVERGYKGKIYQTGGVANVEFLKIGGREINGAYFPTSPVIVAEQLPNGYPTKKKALNFLRAYEGKFGPRAGFAALAWDSIRLVEQAVPKALVAGKPGTEKFRVALRQALENTKGYRGANAVYTLSPTDHSGVNQLGMSIIRIENNKWKLDSHANFK